LLVSHETAVAEQASVVTTHEGTGIIVEQPGVKLISSEIAIV